MRYTYLTLWGAAWLLLGDYLVCLSAVGCTCIRHTAETDVSEDICGHWEAVAWPWSKWAFPRNSELDGQRWCFLSLDQDRSEKHALHICLVLKYPLVGKSSLAVWLTDHWETEGETETQTSSRILRQTYPEGKKKKSPHLHCQIRKCRIAFCRVLPENPHTVECRKLDLSVLERWMAESTLMELKFLHCFLLYKTYFHHPEI